MKPTFTTQTIYRRGFDINWWQTSWQKKDGKLTKKNGPRRHTNFMMFHIWPFRQVTFATHLLYGVYGLGQLLDGLLSMSIVSSVFEFRSTGPRPHINPLHPKPSFITLLLVKNANMKHKKCGKSVDQKNMPIFGVISIFQAFHPVRMVSTHHVRGSGLGMREEVTLISKCRTVG